MLLYSQSKMGRNLTGRPGLTPHHKRLLREWAYHLEDLDRSPKTVENYVLDTRAFLEWLGEAGHDPHPKKLGSRGAQSYRDALVRIHKPATVRRALASLRAFYGWLGVPEVFAGTRVGEVREVATAPRSLTKAEWQKLDRAAEARSEVDGCLALAILRLMRFAGLRVGEVCAVDLPDLECGRRSGRVQVRRGKGLKARTVPLGFEVCDVLREYLGHREQVAERFRKKALVRGDMVPDWCQWPTGRVFLSSRGPYSASGLYRLVESVGREAKVEVHPHTLRHTFAKALIDPKRYGLDRDPLPLSALRQLLGHTSLDTTGVYLLHSEEELEKLMEGR